MPENQNSSNPRDDYHNAVYKLFDEVILDPAFNSDNAFHNAAVAAQTAMGKVDQRLDSLRSAKNATEKQTFSDELQKVESELDTAVIEFLRKSVKSVSVETADAALKLLKAIPAAVSKKYDLAGVKSSLDRIILKQKKAGARLDLLKR